MYTLVTITYFTMEAALPAAYLLCGPQSQAHRLAGVGHIPHRHRQSLSQLLAGLGVHSRPVVRNNDYPGLTLDACHAPHIGMDALHHLHTFRM